MWPTRALFLFLRRGAETNIGGDIALCERTTLGGVGDRYTSSGERACGGVDVVGDNEPAEFSLDEDDLFLRLSGLRRSVWVSN